MNIDWTNLGINAAISLILSLIVFSLGLRAGKERIDRKELREKYRKLTVHFEKLHNRMKHDEPLNWDDFEESKEDRMTLPLVRKMIRKGDHIELNDSLIKALEELEVNSLRYGYYFREVAEKAKNIIIDILKKQNVELKEDSYSVTTNVSDDEANNSYIPYNPAKLLNQNRISVLLTTLSDRKTGLAFKLVIGSHHKYTITIRKQDIKIIPIEDILNEISKELNEIKNDFLENKDELLNLQEKKIKKLKKLTKEPYPFWMTVGNTFKDFFS